MARLISIKHFLWTLLCLALPAATLLTPRAARADSVQVGTISVFSADDMNDESFDQIYYLGIASLTDAMSDTTLTIAGAPYPPGFTDPQDTIFGSTLSEVDWYGFSPEDVFYVFVALGSLDFTLNGQAYQADGLYSMSPTWTARDNEILDIVIDATPIGITDPAPTPEPCSLLLFGTGIFAMAAFSRLSTTVRRSERFESAPGE